MRGGEYRPKIVALTTNRPLTLRLEPPGDSKMIAGWLGNEGGEEHRFSGWLELLTLLERTRQTAADEPQHGVGSGGTGRREKRNE